VAVASAAVVFAAVVFAAAVFAAAAGVDKTPYPAAGEYNMQVEVFPCVNI
jgi:hypothetical protein